MPFFFVSASDGTNVVKVIVHINLCVYFKTFNKRTVLVTVLFYPTPNDEFCISFFKQQPSVVAFLGLYKT